MLGLTVLLTLLTVSTVVPSKVAGKKCLLGYKAHCSFTPVSTVICIMITGAACSYRRRKFTEQVQDVPGKGDKAG